MLKLLFLFLLIGSEKVVLAQAPVGSAGGSSLGSPTQSESIVPGSFVQAPCLDLDEKQALSPPLSALFIPKCSEFLNNQTKDGFLSRYSQFFRERIQCFYEGTIIELSKDVTLISGPQSCSLGKPIYPPPLPKAVVCSIADGEGDRLGSSSGATTPNSLKESCGVLADSSGQWERAQELGLEVQATKFYRNQLIQELLTRKSFQLTSAMCQSQADDYSRLWLETKDLVQKSLLKFSSDQFEAFRQSKSNLCAVESIQLKNGAVAPPSQASCYLKSLMDRLALVFFYLVECETVRRVEGFKADFYDQDLPRLNSIISSCASQAQAHGRSVGEKVGHDSLDKAKGRSAGIRAGEQFGRECYARDALQFIKDVVRTKIDGKFEP